MIPIIKNTCKFVLPFFTLVHSHNLNELQCSSLKWINCCADLIYLFWEVRLGNSYFVSLDNMLFSLTFTTLHRTGKMCEINDLLIILIRGLVTSYLQYFVPVLFINITRVFLVVIDKKMLAFLLRHWSISVWFISFSQSKN